jgi:hypothetical protein
MGGVTGTVTGKVTGLFALTKTFTAGVVVAYHWASKRVVCKPWAAVAPAATLPEEHMCGVRVVPVGRALVRPQSNLVTQYFEPGIAGVVPTAAV